MDASVELVKRLLPSVVHIHTEVPAAHPSARVLGDERMGTGVIVDSSGLILTVNYVVMGGETIQVSFSKGRPQRAELVAQDFELGLALLKVKRTSLPTVPVAASDHLDRGGHGWESSPIRSTRAWWWRDWCPTDRAPARASARGTSSCRSTRSRCRRGRICTCRCGGGGRGNGSRSR